MERLTGELNRRWGEMFESLAQGEDVPPARRLRTEGMMEAAVLLGLASPQELVLAMTQCYEEVCGRHIAAEFGEDWQDFFPFPQIPAMARRAPVFPSTAD